jgi:hypothetical protein
VRGRTQPGRLQTGSRLVGSRSATDLTGLAILASMESACLDALRPSRHELHWVGDAIVATFVARTTYLRLRLSAARTQAEEMNRARSWSTSSSACAGQPGSLSPRVSRRQVHTATEHFRDI